MIHLMFIKMLETDLVFPCFESALTLLFYRLLYSISYQDNVYVTVSPLPEIPVTPSLMPYTKTAIPSLLEYKLKLH
jgi:hypothetical protein